MKNDVKSNGNRESDAIGDPSDWRQILAPGIGRRISKVVELYRTKKSAAYAAGKSVDSLDRYIDEVGRDGPPFAAMVGLARSAGVSLDWLATGEGAMLALTPWQVAIAEIWDRQRWVFPPPPDTARRLFCAAYNRGEIEVPAVLHKRVPKVTETELCRWYRAWEEQNEERALAEGAAGYGSSEDYVFVPRYDVGAAGGDGSAISNEQIVDRLAFRRAWVTREGLQADKLALIRADGESMAPAILDGDLLLVDKRDTDAAADSIYVLRDDDHLRVKRVQRRIGGGLLLMSDSSAYSDEEISREQLADVHVVGRVVWVGRRV